MTNHSVVEQIMVSPTNLAVAIYIMIFVLGRKVTMARSEKEYINPLLPVNVLMSVLSKYSRRWSEVILLSA
jgi:hypothetical protein